MIETLLRTPLLAYPLGFTITVMLPNWRSLGVAAAILAIPFASLLAWVYAGAAAAPGGSAIGAWVLFLLLTIFGGGLVCGVATRALLLGLREHELSHIGKAMVLLLGFCLVPAVVKLYSWHREQDRLPPAAECTTQSYPFRIVGVKYQLPVSPAIFISVSNGSHYSMASNRSLKELCQEKNFNAGAATPAVAVSFNSHRLRNINDPLRIQYCSRQVGILASNLCRQSSARPAQEGLLDLHLYSLDEYDHKRMIISSQGAHSTFLGQQTKDLENRVDAPRARDGVLESHADGYWVAHDNKWLNEAGEPFTLRCQPSNIGLLTCRTTYRLATGPQVTYSFNARHGRIEEVARSVDQQVRQGLDELSPPMP